MTTDSMEVDPPPGGAEAAGDGGGGGGQAQEKTLKVHPLALIGISDHHTRVVTGGSALPPTAPVMGLLFGYQDGLTVSILDAEEMEYSFADPSSDGGGGGFGGGTEEQQSQHRSILRTKIDLHQKVFPTHEVIGWYRVDNAADGGGGGGPTEEDLRMNTGKMREYNESPLFVLMNAAGTGAGRHHGNSKASNDADKKPSADSASSTTTAGQEARERLDRDEQLPLSIYETLIVTTTTSSSSSAAAGGDGGAAAAAAGGAAGAAEAQPRAVFVNLEFELETFEPERIAVEKVFKTRPSVAAAAAKAEANAAAVASTATAAAEGSGAGGKEPALRARNVNAAEGGGNDDAAASSSAADGAAPSASSAANPPPAPIPATGLDVHLQSMKDSIVSMNDRIEILLDFLRRTRSGDIPPDYNLLRQVDGLVRQLPLVRVGQRGDKGASSGSGGGGPIGKEFEVEYDDMMMLSYLAAVAKTARAVQTYSDKFRLVQDGNGRGGDSYMRRAY